MIRKHRGVPITGTPLLLNQQPSLIFLNFKLISWCIIYDILRNICFILFPHNICFSTFYFLQKLKASDYLLVPPQSIYFLVLANLFMCLGLNLPYTLSGDTKHFAHFFKCVCKAIHKAVAHF